MSSFNLSLDAEALKDTLQLIENDIQELEEVLKNTYSATNTLDEQKWSSTEKRKLDSEYVPYLKKISEVVPLALRREVAFTRAALDKYETLEAERLKKAENLVDGTTSATKVEG